MKKDEDAGEHGESKSRIIREVKTALGFFTLATLIASSILGYGIIASRCEDRTLLILGGIGIIVLAILSVLLITFFHPKHLLNQADIAQSPGLAPSKKQLIEGEYCAGNDLKYKVSLTRLTGDYYKVDNPDWEGVGFFDGKYYYGVFKMNDKATPPDRRGNWGAHRNLLTPETESFEVFGIELKEKLKCDEFDEAQGWIKQAG